jgi:hypothetical protein
MSRWLAAALVAASLPQLAWASKAGRCAEISAALADVLTEIECFESADLTTNGPLTTPGDNTLAGVPAGAFTPTTDRGVISPAGADRTPIVKVVPGIQLEARLAGDPEARFLLRLPDGWNGRLVVAGASGTRSEFNGDFAWSDYVVQKGYAYASQNKGIFNLRVTNAADPLACRFNPDVPIEVLAIHFFVNDPGNAFSEWQERVVEAARLAREGVRARYGHAPRRTYAVGTSNGGYQVRRAVEEAPELFDGGVDWEGTFVEPGEHNLLVQLPAAIRHYPDYRASDFDPDSAAAHAIRAAGYPPDIVIRDAAGAVTASLWRNHWNQFWEVTQCQWQKRLDPGYDTYVSGTGNYDYFARAATTDVDEGLRAFETTGKIKRPLVTVGGTLDALLPTVHHARAYAAKVAASRKGNDARRHAQHRLYEVQNGNHIETYKAVAPGAPNTFPQLEYVQPHAQRAFDLLVAHVEEGAPLPPDQCVPRGGAIAATPAPGQRGTCKELLVE